MFILGFLYITFQNINMCKNKIQYIDFITTTTTLVTFFYCTFVVDRKSSIYIPSRCALKWTMSLNVTSSFLYIIWKALEAARPPMREALAAGLPVLAAPLPLDTVASMCTGTLGDTRKPTRT